MPKVTKAAKLIAPVLLVCFLLSGCQLFTSAKQRLNTYCPGLKIGLNGVSWSSNRSGDVYILNYSAGDQGRVTAYFADTANRFAGGNARSYMDIKDGDDRAIADGDSIVSKTIAKPHKTATVIYNATTRRIIIIDDTLK
jgi:hypothetical protein